MRLGPGGRPRRQVLLLLLGLSLTALQHALALSSVHKPQELQRQAREHGNVIAGYCQNRKRPACRALKESLEQTKQQFKGTPVRFVMLSDNKQRWSRFIGDASLGVWHVCHDGKGINLTPFEPEITGVTGQSPVSPEALSSFAVHAAETAGAACMRKLLRSVLASSTGAGYAGHDGAGSGTAGGAGGAAGRKAAGGAGEARRGCLLSGACSSPWFASLSSQDLSPGGRVAKSPRPWFVLFCYPWKRSCLDLVPTWIDTARKLKHAKLHIGVIDCTQHIDACRLLGSPTSDPTTRHNLGLSSASAAAASAAPQALLFARTLESSNPQGPGINLGASIEVYEGPWRAGSLAAFAHGRVRAARRQLRLAAIVVAPPPPPVPTVRVPAPPPLVRVEVREGAAREEDPVLGMPLSGGGGRGSEGAFCRSCASKGYALVSCPSASASVIPAPPAIIPVPPRASDDGDSRGHGANSSCGGGGGRNGSGVVGLFRGSLAPLWGAKPQLKKPAHQKGVLSAPAAIAGTGAGAGSSGSSGSSINKNTPQKAPRGAGCNNPPKPRVWWGAPAPPAAAAGAAAAATAPPRAPHHQNLSAEPRQPRMAAQRRQRWQVDISQRSNAAVQDWNLGPLNVSAPASVKPTGQTATAASQSATAGGQSATADDDGDDMYTSFSPASPLVLLDSAHFMIYATLVACSWVIVAALAIQVATPHAVRVCMLYAATAAASHAAALLGGAGACAALWTSAAAALSATCAAAVAALRPFVVGVRDVTSGLTFGGLVGGVVSRAQRAAEWCAGALAACGPPTVLASVIAEALLDVAAAARRATAGCRRSCSEVLAARASAACVAARAGAAAVAARASAARVAVRAVVAAAVLEARAVAAGVVAVLDEMRAIAAGEPERDWDAEGRERDSDEQDEDGVVVDAQPDDEQAGSCQAVSETADDAAAAASDAASLCAAASGTDAPEAVEPSEVATTGAASEGGLGSAESARADTSAAVPGFGLASWLLPRSWRAQPAVAAAAAATSAAATSTVGASSSRSVNAATMTGPAAAAGTPSDRAGAAAAATAAEAAAAAAAQLDNEQLLHDNEALLALAEAAHADRQALRQALQQVVAAAAQQARAADERLSLLASQSHAADEKAEDARRAACAAAADARGAAARAAAATGAAAVVSAEQRALRAALLRVCDALMAGGVSDSGGRGRAAIEAVEALKNEVEGFEDSENDALANTVLSGSASGVAAGGNAVSSAADGALIAPAGEEDVREEARVGLGVEGAGDGLGFPEFGGFPFGAISGAGAGDASPAAGSCRSGESCDRDSASEGWVEVPTGAIG